jgi:polysaccharide export outer membrane protein
VLAALAIAVAGGTASAAGPDSTLPGPSEARVALDAGDPSDRSERGYRLTAGDLVRVTVYQNPDLTLETRLPDSGRIRFPLLGPVQLGGLTVAQGEERLAQGLRDGRLVRAPQVTLALLEATGRQASVLGQVNRPGRYPIALSGLRLTELLALAGGATATGAERVILSGLRDGQPWRTEIDLPALFANADRSADPPIEPGDTVWVDRQAQVYVVGEVQRPGALRLERRMTLLQVLAAGGGLTPRGTERGIRVHRTLPDGRIQMLQPAMDALLRPGDVVQVAESLF